MGNTTLFSTCATYVELRAKESLSWISVMLQKKTGLRTVSVKATIEKLTNRVPLPCIIH